MNGFNIVLEKLSKDIVLDNDIKNQIHKLLIFNFNSITYNKNIKIFQYFKNLYFESKFWKNINDMTVNKICNKLKTGKLKLSQDPRKKFVKNKSDDLKKLNNLKIEYNNFFIKSIKKRKNDNKLKIWKLIEKNEIRKNGNLNMIKQKELMKTMNFLNEKKNSIKERINQINENKEKRLKFHLENQQIIREKLKIKPLYKILKENYDKSENLRFTLKKPKSINHLNLKNHQKDFDLKIKERNLKPYNFLQLKPFQFCNYQKNYNYKKKIENYSSVINWNFKPTISIKKKNELIKLKKKINWLKDHKIKLNKKIMENSIKYSKHIPLKLNKKKYRSMNKSINENIKSVKSSKIVYKNYLQDLNLKSQSNFSLNPNLKIIDLYQNINIMDRKLIYLSSEKNYLDSIKNKINLLNKL